MRALPLSLRSDHSSGVSQTVAPTRPQGSPVVMLVVSALLVALALRVIGAPLSPAGAVQPYAPRGIAASPVPASDWFALAVRASGFRPNTTVLVDVDGVGQRSMVADAAGVVDVRIELPDRVGVQVRGVALEGGGLELRQEVALVRRDDSTRTLLLAVLAAGALVAAVISPRLRRRSSSPDATPHPDGIPPR
jgi:hypothetical protein